MWKWQYMLDSVILTIEFKQIKNELDKDTFYLYHSICIWCCVAWDTDDLWWPVHEMCICLYTDDYGWYIKQGAKRCSSMRRDFLGVRWFWVSPIHNLCIGLMGIHFLVTGNTLVSIKNTHIMLYRPSLENCSSKHRYRYAP